MNFLTNCTKIIRSCLRQRDFCILSIQCIFFTRKFRNILLPNNHFCLNFINWLDFKLRRIIFFAGTAVVQCLRFCATNRKVAGSIPDGVIGIFH